MDYTGERERLIKWTHQRSQEDLASYHETKNSVSIDGLTAVDSPTG